MDVNKYRALFIAESREHLAATSKVLVDLEGLDTATAAPMVDELFRHVHSIKGMSASMGYEPIAAIAHRLEDVVGMYQDESMSSETIDLLLRGVDALVDQIEAIAAERTLEQHPQILRALQGEHQKRKAAEAPSAGPVGSEREIVVRLDEATAAPQVRAFLIYRRLAKMVEIESSLPSVDDIKAGKATQFELRFITASAFDESDCRRQLRALADVEDVQFYNAGEAPGKKSDRRVATARPPTTSVSVATVRVRTDILDELIDTVGELFIARERLCSLLTDAVPEVDAALDIFAARIREIHDQVMSVRMMPLRTVTDRYPRLVRDLSRGLGKDVTIEVEGADIELDRAVLDNLDSPFVHAIRNAVDHGLEHPAERLERKKPAAGKVTISATRDRDSVLVSIEDDGRGLDAEQLRKKAIARGLITEEQAATMDARESFFLICTPGFSTKTEVSDVSGRGVGMDAVRSTIEGMGGSLDIESEKGRGTRLIFRLPLTLSIIPVLLVEVAGRVFAVPAAKVVAVKEPGNDLFEQAGGDIYLSFQHAFVLVSPVAELLELRRRGRIVNVVVLEDGRDLYAIAVDRIVGYQEVVVKPLGDPLDRLEWFAGATVLGDGQPVLILDMPRALRNKPRAAA